MKNVRHLINITDLTIEEINHLIEVADDIYAHPENYYEACKNKNESAKGRVAFEYQKPRACQPRGCL